MKSISLYEEKNSFLNRLSPESKILYVLSAVFIPIFMGNHMASTGFILLSALLLWFRRNPKNHTYLRCVWFCGTHRAADSGIVPGWERNSVLWHLGAYLL